MELRVSSADAVLLCKQYGVNNVRVCLDWLLTETEQ